MVDYPPDRIEVPDAPPISGLVFRRYRGESDHAQIAGIVTAGLESDGVDRVTTVEDVNNNYAHLVNCDLYRDMILAEVDGRLAAYWRGEWWEEDGGPLLYGIIGYTHPNWRETGIDRAGLRWLENRLREVASDHPPKREKFLQTWVPEAMGYLERLLESEGYNAVRFGYGMVRPSLEDIPDFPLPQGLEVRPVLPEHYRAIWDADIEAFHDHWGFAEPAPDRYEAWLNETTIFQPELWQIAWDTGTDEIAGQVRSFINRPENEKFNRQRGYTEFISVRRPWRRRGLARALIGRSLVLLREAGMTEAALGVDSENTSGAVRLYEDCGFVVDSRSVTLRKPLFSIT
jgi:mycothiol synthase